MVHAGSISLPCRARPVPWKALLFEVCNAVAQGERESVAGIAVQDGRPSARAARSANAYHSNSAKKALATIFEAGVVRFGARGERFLDSGNRQQRGMLDMSSSASVTRNCIAARTQPNWPAE
jgi:hypothetical protein